MSASINRKKGHLAVNRRYFLKTIAYTGGGLALGGLLGGCGGGTMDPTLVAGLETALSQEMTVDAPILPATFDVIAQRHRPYMFLTGGVKLKHILLWPCSWQWYYQRAVLSNGDDVNIGTDYQKVLNAEDVRNGQYSNDYSVIIGEDYYDGENYTELMNGGGVYCHISYLGNLLYNVEYWVLFAYNEPSSDFVPNHVGDLVCMQMVVNYYGRVSRMGYFQHGDAFELFDTHGAGFDLVTLHGKTMTGGDLPVRVKKVYPIRSHQEGPGLLWGREYVPCDDYVYLAAEGNSDEFTHPVMYFETGSHEPWPNTSGAYPWADTHSINAITYLPGAATILSNTDAPFVFFGGTYGDPAGIARHRPWYLKGYDKFHATDNHEDYPAIPDGNRVDPDPYANYSGGITWPPTE
jgi:hypothetical protein